MKNICLIVLLYLLSINTANSGIFGFFDSEPIIEVKFDDGSICEKPYFLHVIINNVSSKTITNTQFNIILRKKGYSGDIFNSRQFLTTDKIIKSNEKFETCFNLSSLSTLSLIAIFEGSDRLSLGLNGYNTDNSYEKIYEFIERLKNLDLIVSETDISFE